MKPDLRDLHVYGGILLCGIGAGFWSLAAALVVVGAGLAYLGIRTVN